MRTAFYFIVTCFVSTEALLNALGSKNPWPNFAVAFGIWILFLWGYSRRLKKAEEKRRRERLFEDYVRMQMRNQKRY